jgi:hypothetical protein
VSLPRREKKIESYTIIASPYPIDRGIIHHPWQSRKCRPFGSQPPLLAAVEPLPFTPLSALPHTPLPLQPSYHCTSSAFPQNFLFLVSPAQSLCLESIFPSIRPLLISLGRWNLRYFAVCCSHDPDHPVAPQAAYLLTTRPENSLERRPETFRHHGTVRYPRFPSHGSQS